MGYLSNFVRNHPLLAGLIVLLINLVIWGGIFVGALLIIRAIFF